MEVKELMKSIRLGNLLMTSNQFDTPEIGVVHSLSNLGCDLFINGNEWPHTYKQVKPIPLTEAWLLKFGFEKQGIFYRIDKIKITYRDCWRFEYGGFITKIYHVHQLQNLYFALTGKELSLAEQPNIVG